MAKDLSTSSSALETEFGDYLSNAEQGTENVWNLDLENDVDWGEEARKQLSGKLISFLKPYPNYPINVDHIPETMAFIWGEILCKAAASVRSSIKKADPLLVESSDIKINHVDLILGLFSPEQLLFLISVKSGQLRETHKTGDLLRCANYFDSSASSDGKPFFSDYLIPEHADNYHRGRDALFKKQESLDKRIKQAGYEVESVYESGDSNAGYRIKAHRPHSGDISGGLTAYSKPSVSSGYFVTTTFGAQS